MCLSAAHAWGVCCSKRPEITLCKGTALCPRHVWSNKWQKGEVKVELILQRLEQLRFVLHKQRCGFHSSDPDSTQASAGRKLGARPLCSSSLSARERAAQLRQRNASLCPLCFCLSEPLLPFWLFFLVQGAEMCAESLRFETGSLLRSDNDTWQVLPFAAINYS